MINVLNVMNVQQLLGVKLKLKAVVVNTNVLLWSSCSLFPYVVTNVKDTLVCKRLLLGVVPLEL